MEVFKLHELLVFAACFMAGVTLGVIFDFFRAIRKCFRISDWVVAVQDMLFWLIACVIVYSAIFLSNSAELRWFELIGLTVGTGVYILVLSSKFVRFMCRLIRCFVCFLQFVSKPVVIPFRGAVRLCVALRKHLQMYKMYVLYNLHKLFLKTSHKMRLYRENICKKFFFTFLKR